MTPPSRKKPAAKRRNAARAKKRGAIAERNARAQSAKRRFDRAHAKGTRGLNERNFDQVAEAIAEESKAIEEFRKVTTANPFLRRRKS